MVLRYASVVCVIWCLLSYAHASRRVKSDILPRSVHAFMYLWYGEPDTDGAYKHWNHEVLPHWEPRINTMYPNIGKRFNPPRDVHSPFYPLHGPYSSINKDVLHRQFKEMTHAGIDVAVVSWWGQKDKPYATDTQGVNTDEAFARLLQEADVFNSAQTAGDKGATSGRHIKIALHLEPYPSRSVTSVHDDLQYLQTNYGHHSCLFRSIDGRPVYYVYDSYHIASAQWSRLLSRDGDLSVRNTPADGVMLGLWLDHHHGRDLHDAHFDGFYTYFGANGFSYGSTAMNWANMCVFARKTKMVCGLSVGPGYNDTLIRPWNERNTRSRDGGRYYESMWQQALKARPAVISITSYNEWGEGTQIEPARSFWLQRRSALEPLRSDSLDILGRSTVQVTSEQLQRGIDLDKLAERLEDHASLDGLPLYSSPHAEVRLKPCCAS